MVAHPKKQKGRKASGRDLRRKRRTRMGTIRLPLAGAALVVEEAEDELFGPDYPPPPPEASGEDF